MNYGEVAIPAFVNSFAELSGGGPPKRRFAVVGPLPINRMSFRIRSLSEGQLSAYEAVSVGKDGFRPASMQTAGRRLIALCVVDADGNRLMTDEQANKVLAGWDSADTNFLYEAINAHIGRKKDDIEALAKNSETTTDGSSLTE